MAELKKQGDDNNAGEGGGAGGGGGEGAQTQPKERGAEPSGKDLAARARAEREAAEKPVEPKRCPKGALYLESESTSPGGRGCWYARVPHTHTIDDVLSPHYFGQFQSDEGGLRPGDKIEIETESGLWSIEVRVMAKIPKISQVKVRERPGSRQSFAVKPPPGVKFEWRGGQAKWVLMKGDVEVDGGFDSQDDALARFNELTKEKAA